MQDSPNPEREKIREQIRLQTIEYERKYGKIETMPIIRRHASGGFNARSVCGRAESKHNLALKLGKELRIQEAADFKAQGLTNKEIAEIMNVTVQCVGQYLKIHRGYMESCEHEAKEN